MLVYTFGFSSFLFLVELFCFFFLSHSLLLLGCAFPIILKLLFRLLSLLPYIVARFPLFLSIMYLLCFRVLDLYCCLSCRKDKYCFSWLVGWVVAPSYTFGNFKQPILDYRLLERVLDEKHIKKVYFLLFRTVLCWY